MAAPRPAGRGLADLRTDLANSPEAASSIGAVFRQALGQGASAPVVQHWQGVLATGGSLDALRQAFTSLTQDQDIFSAAASTISLVQGGSGGFDPATNAQAGWAPAGTTLTLAGPDGSTLAVNSARDLLAVLPVYVTLAGGQTPNLVLQDGRHVTFGNAVDLANYLNRTAQDTAPADPALGGDYQVTMGWLTRWTSPPCRRRRTTQRWRPTTPAPTQTG